MPNTLDTSEYNVPSAKLLEALDTTTNPVTQSSIRACLKARGINTPEPTKVATPKDYAEYNDERQLWS